MTCRACAGTGAIAECAQPNCDSNCQVTCPECGGTGEQPSAAPIDRDAQAGHRGITNPTAATRRSPLFKAAQRALIDGSPNARLV